MLEETPFDFPRRKFVSFLGISECEATEAVRNELN